MPALIAGVTRAAKRLGVDLRRPVTLIGVAALDEPDMLVEVDAPGGPALTGSFIP